MEVISWILCSLLLPSAPFPCVRPVRLVGLLRSDNDIIFVLNPQPPISVQSVVCTAAIILQLSTPASHFRASLSAPYYLVRDRARNLLLAVCLMTRYDSTIPEPEGSGQQDQIARFSFKIRRVGVVLACELDRRELSKGQSTLVAVHQHRNHSTTGL